MKDSRLAFVLHQQGKITYELHSIICESRRICWLIHMYAKYRIITAFLPKGSPFKPRYCYDRRTPEHDGVVCWTSELGGVFCWTSEHYSAICWTSDHDGVYAEHLNLVVFFAEHLNIILRSAERLNIMMLFLLNTWTL